MVFKFKKNSKNNQYSSGSFNIGSGPVLERFDEVEGWINYFKETKNSKNKKNSTSVNRGLESVIGYFVVIKDKLKDELLMANDDLRNLNIQIKRLGRDFESKRSELENKVKRRDLVLKEYADAKNKRDSTDKESGAYAFVQEEYYHKKKEKEDIEISVRRNTLLCKNLIQNIEIMKLSSEQNKLSLVQGEKILERVEEAIESINFVYQSVALIAKSDKDVKQITGGEDVKK